ncbi:MAG: sulfatase-like hydrolase/transferase [Promethearchaeota archaeon]
MIILDSLRADKINGTHDGKLLTPNIKNLLNNSLFFKNCISNSTWTLPSHLSMFTGLYPTQIKLTGKHLDRLSEKVPVLTEILKDQGYYTICYTENPWVSSYFRVTRGFHKTLYNYGLSFFNMQNSKSLKAMNLLLNSFNKNIVKKIKSEKFLDLWKIINLIIENTNKRILRTIFWKKYLREYKNTINILKEFKHILPKAIGGKPLYLFLNIMATHSPYIPVKEALDYLKITFKDIKVLKHFLLNPGIYFNRINLRSKFLNEEQIKAFRKLYDSCVYYCDLIIEKLILILKKIGLLENSYIIITSDHGEHLCSYSDHYLYGHGVYQSVFDSQIRVPFIIYNPKIKYRVIEDQVELKDLFYTISQLIGFSNDKYKSLNLKKSILYQINNMTTPKYIFGEHLKPKREILSLIKTFKRQINPSLIPKLFYNIYFVRSPYFKYIKYENEIEEFYDLINDPYEQTNIISDDNEEYQKMKLFLEQHLKNIKNPKNLTKILTKKEKLVIRRATKNIKI